LLGILYVVAVALYDDGNADAVAEAETFKSHLRYAQIGPWATSTPGPSPWAAAATSCPPQNPSIGTPVLPGESGATHTVRDGVSVSGGTVYVRLARPGHHGRRDRHHVRRRSGYCRDRPSGDRLCAIDPFAAHAASP
jgi:hypothetical protein